MKKQCLRALKKAYVILHRINYKSIRHIFRLTFPVNAKRIRFFSVLLTFMLVILRAVSVLYLTVYINNIPIVLLRVLGNVLFV